VRRVLLLALIAATASDARADEACGLEDPAIAASAPPVGERAASRRMRAAWDRPLVGRPRGGALAGKTVYVSAGHGWVWDDSLGRWRSQRGNTHDLVEDFVSAETVSQHLIPYLWDMGAYVVPVREASMQTEMVIGDAPAIEGGSTEIAEGWATPPGPLTGDTPFAAGGSIVLDPGATATWTLEVPVDGEYDVYLAWVQGPDRASDARYLIRHGGGDTELRVDQRRHGSTWVLVGRFFFPEGDASISVENDGDAVVSADAVRLGGGLGHVDRGGGASNRPAFEDGARYAAQWNGAPATVWDYAAEDGNDDVGTRSRFSAWDHEDGEDAVYVAWHTNAPSPARGTSSFAYGPEPFGDLSQFTGVPGSLELMDAIHSELIADFRASWEPGWQDRGQHTAYFGEVNPSHNPEMPATLIEVAFHDTAEDAAALREPRFRGLAARAIAHGIARYFAARDGVTLTLPPEPPARVRMIQDRISWDPPPVDPAGGDAPTGYRVYLSRDGRGFDDGVDLTGTELVVDLDRVTFARVTATNAGGESRPSAVVGSVRAPSGQAMVLVVAGFTRIDGTMLFREDLSAYSLATIDRAYEHRINDGSYAARHGLALAAGRFSFDVVTADALGAVDLTAYQVIDWIAGEEIAPVVDVAGRPFIIGTTDASALGVVVFEDDAGTYRASFHDLPLDFSDSDPGGYDAEAPDSLRGIGLFDYDTGEAAAMQEAGGIVLGFPIETVRGEAQRAELMRRLLEVLSLFPDIPEVEVGDETSGGCCDAGGERPVGALLLALGVLAALTRRARGWKTSAS
jgi:hypothetical protein